LKTPESESKRLRAFGLIMAALLALLCWRWGRKGWAIAPWLGVLGVLSALIALARPLRLEPLERGWMKAARVAARINTAVILTLLFYSVVVPLGFLMRFTSGDPLEAKPEGESYWKRRTSGEDSASYESQF
jgi:saxitoxin biosynthesis operon SxtJ-like protein